ncbi:MAG: DUF362 domain-containing protein [Candidatus Methanomethylophilaceae archaeon]|jgi:uncharacterized Fe-S center protein|nr:DUF362 domain-containing protein [Candidatus Methanomethylophilaceae archaeon]
MTPPSRVYFADMRTDINDSLLDKLGRVIDAAGMDGIDMERKFVALKMHFGERGNLSFLRPNFAKVVADRIRSLGGIPYLTDTNTLYPGGRKNAPDHLQTACENGFGPATTGCHVIIADGIRGTDDAEVPVDGEYVRSARIGRGIVDSDIIVTLTHFKCHELTGFGGAVKNLAMGCASRRGKMEMHSEGRPEVDAGLCRECGRCVESCGSSAISLEGGPAAIDPVACVGCGRCVAACPFDAITAPTDQRKEVLNAKMVEYAMAALDGRPSFHVSVIMDVSPFCDCHGENDLPVIPDVGMLASFDPVALDRACVDLCNSSEAVPGSLLHERCGGNGTDDIFSCTQPESDWRSLFEHAAKMGFGTSEYELIRVR